MLCWMQICDDFQVLLNLRRVCGEGAASAVGARLAAHVRRARVAQDHRVLGDREVAPRAAGGAVRLQASRVASLSRLRAISSGSQTVVVYVSLFR